MPSEADYRLSRTVVPSHYAITLTPDLEAATFSGSVVVEVDVHEPVTEIVVNAIELEISRARLVEAGGRSLDATVSYDEATERAFLDLGGEAEAGAARLEMEFTGILNDKLRGFYRATYTTPEGEKKTIATTQFEATDARRAFPCWDEPDLKATYEVTLVVDEGLFAVSNAAEIGREPAGGGKVAVRFAPTMKMSTYLVAFVVGDLVATDPVDVDGIPIRIVHQPGQEKLAEFALDVGAHCLRYYTEYYGIPYPGDKLDMIAIPDFAWGAMENLGCITYRETALLVDRPRASQIELVRVADVIAHEIAHMWFGDLVTMKWWNGIWLNEAFATFAEMKCVDAYRPDWKRWVSFSAARTGSMETDALEATRPIEFPVASPEEANEMFDTLTYQKGSAVLRMLEQYLGEERFRAGVAAYLERHAYGNAETADLWAALEEVSGEPVGRVMDEWIFKGGFPCVTVETAPDGYRLSQDQFRYLAPGDGTWPVPVLYRSEQGSGKHLLMEDTTIEAGPGFVANEGGNGYYRVRYAPEVLADLRRRFADLDPAERYGVVSDTWAAVLSGDTPAAEYVALAGALSDEQDVDVWSAVLGGLGELDRVVSSDTRPELQQFVDELVSPRLDELGWSPGPDESDRTRRLRGLLIRAKGNLAKDSEVQATARDVWARAREGEAFDAEVRDAALSVVAANGALSEFESFLAASASADTPQDTVKFLRAATAVPEPDAVERLHTMVLDGSIRRQDSFWILALLLGHRENGPRAWELMKERWDDTIASMPPTNARRMLDLVPYRSEPDVAADIEAWLADHPIPGGGKYSAQQIELMKVRVGLRGREADRLF